MPNDLENQKREREKERKEEMRSQQEKYKAELIDRANEARYKAENEAGAELNQKLINLENQKREREKNEAKYNRIPFKNTDIDRMEARKRKLF